MNNEYYIYFMVEDKFPESLELIMATSLWTHNSIPGYCWHILIMNIIIYSGYQRFENKFYGIMNAYRVKYNEGKIDLKSVTYSII